MMEQIDEMTYVIVERMASYEFETFTVGATLKPSILDRDDYIRSKFRAKGTRSVKTSLTTQLADNICKRTKKKLDRTNPDITVLMDTRFGSCEIRSRQILIQAQYTKNCRGIPQKDTTYDRHVSPRNSGCDIYSIYGIFQQYLRNVIRGTDFCFVWCGGEDATSRVLGEGRRFYVRVKNPQRRRISHMPETKDVQFHNIRIISSMPARMPTMRSEIRMVVRFPEDTPVSLRSLHHMDKTVHVRDQAGKVSIKKIHSIHYRRISHASLQVVIDVEGGIPVKRFVSGCDVWPSVSSTLQVKCECWRFDFLDIKYY
ncbi:MAG: hypothetical protein F4W68_00980 [Cenarchaeum sp. SB0661_bin_35]|nr:hypothetical protein [Cenarchaeum sp. SB0667_bin_13]MXY37662.1 hypothetical protein [Cenarchaeum sp. SB0664_bin_35]MXZ93120.1 hypothetical protein [Cenarchaeum sp. SB0666_bin_15]MYB47504.1 hypothetical protein [Cenarchaeum sp. SB0662_bin_33]MYC79069.1 hypothetical protein [Cenarchaeum sp. SB0661_bin_35]MYD58590.1 hypothetical protein [Cenarchaeum sp. SB0678_bin_8]MYI51627.1 hypothetical protein [Cenarchaeum sp. SB0673_bin_9]MYJ27725.1 hypothetical protein [Cenarchaeum sp. SB0672_bin_9]